MKLSKIKNRMEWQIDRRYHIQRLLFDIHSFMKGEEDLPNVARRHLNLLGRITATAFSLWRSAFLTHAERNPKSIYKDTIDFLDKLVEQNAISFADDHKMCELTVDYYNSNARYRLDRMISVGPNYWTLQSLAKLYKQRDADVTAQNQRNLWDEYFIAAKESFEVFEREWLENKPPLLKRPLTNRKKTSAGGSKAAKRR